MIRKHKYNLVKDLINEMREKIMKSEKYCDSENTQYDKLIKNPKQKTIHIRR